jgi:hypothetical protein
VKAAGLDVYHKCLVRADRVGVFVLAMARIRAQGYLDWSRVTWCWYGGQCVGDSVVGVGAGYGRWMEGVVGRWGC